MSNKPNTIEQVLKKAGLYDYKVGSKYYEASHNDGQDYDATKRVLEAIAAIHQLIERGGVMSKGILEFKRYWSGFGDYDWQYRPVIVLSEGKNSWRIWSWREPFTRIVHKRANHEKVVVR